MEAKAAEINKQQRELQTLRVKKQIAHAMYEDVMISPIHTLVVRRTKEGCRQTWLLRMVKYSNMAQN